MKKILSILTSAFIAPLTATSVVSCGKKLDSDIAKKLNYTNDEGNSNLVAQTEFKDGKFIYKISGHDTINNKVSNDDISDAKIKSFVEKTLKVSKKEEFKDIVEEFKDIRFDTKVEANKVKFTKGVSKVSFKIGNSELKTFSDIKIKDFEMVKADIENLLNQITEQDFTYDDLKNKKIDEEATFKTDSTAGKALIDFAKAINKKHHIKIVTQDVTQGATLKISLQDLDAEKIINVKPA